jgi:hypothetical protein
VKKHPKTSINEEEKNLGHRLNTAKEQTQGDFPRPPGNFL